MYYLNMNYIKLTCAKDGCENTFERYIGEHNRSVKLGRKEYCCIAHSGNINRIPKEKRYHLDNLNSSNRLDEFSKFRSHFRRLKNRKHKIELTLEDLKEQWEKQDGKCPLTGWNLFLDRTTKTQRGNEKIINLASLDRIDPKRGYEKDNIRWICVIANYARNNYTDDDVIKFAKAVVNQL